MPSQDYRIEKDSLGEVRVPANALYFAQTQRAIERTSPISGLRFGRSFIRALGLIKSAAAAVSQELGLIDGTLANAIRRAAAEVGVRLLPGRARFRLRPDKLPSSMAALFTVERRC